MDKNCSHQACVSLVPIFNHLPIEQLTEVMKSVQSITYQKGAHIYHAGDQSDSLYIVNEGKIRIYRLAESGKEQLVRILTPGEFTGELALFAEKEHEAFAQAMEVTSVCLIKRGDLQQLLVKYPSISQRILAEFAHRLDQSEQQTTRFATETVETRLALFLIECRSDSDEETFLLPMSRKDLAGYLGTTPETISRKLTEFEQRGYLKQHGHKKIELLDIGGMLMH